jgi:protein XagA
MLYNKIIISSLILISSFVASSAFAGPWVPLKGDGIAIWSLRYAHSDEFFDGNGNRISSSNDGRFSKYETSVFTAVGLGGHFGMFASVSAAHLNYKDAFVDESSTGLGNSELGIMYQFLDYPYPAMGLSLKANIPTFTPRDKKPVLGNDFMEYELMYSVGYGFEAGSTPAFLDAGIGYLYLDNEFSESRFRGYLTGGSKISDKLDWFGGGEYVRSFNTDFNLFKVALTGVYNINKSYSLALGSDYILLGRNVGTGPSVALALWYKF